MSNCKMPKLQKIVYITLFHYVMLYYLHPQIFNHKLDCRVVLSASVCLFAELQQESSSGSWAGLLVFRWRRCYCDYRRMCFPFRPLLCNPTLSSTLPQTPTWALTYGLSIYFCPSSALGDSYTSHCKTFETELSQTSSFLQSLCDCKTIPNG